jgi:hypothetical protein
MRLAPLFAFALLCSNCTVGQRPSAPSVALPYDCHLVAMPFEVEKQSEAAAQAFDQQPDGVLLVEHYYNTSRLDNTRFLDLTTHVLTVSDYRGTFQQLLAAALAEQVDSLCRNVEQGSFRQVCVAGPSEGSSTLLLVKANSHLVLQYEARQYDYRHLNPSERGKLSQALTLMKLLDQAIH